MAKRLGKKKWYAVKVQPGAERRVRSSIRRKARIEGLERYVGRCLVPTRVKTVVVNGARQKRREKLYPEYVLVECHYTEDVFYLLRAVNGTILPDPSAPIPIPMKEMRGVLFEVYCEKEDRKEREGKEEKHEFPFAVGDTVTVIDGMFAGESGPVKRIIPNGKESFAVVGLGVMGRTTDVHLKWYNVNKEG